MRPVVDAEPRRRVVISSFFKGVAFGAIACVVVLSASAALAGTGVGAVFNLGTANTVNSSTLLQGTTRGQQLRVVNSATGSGVAGVGIVTPSAVPPLAVSSSTKVGHLNADLLDGLNSTSFVFGGGRIVSARREATFSAAPLVVLGVPGFGNVEATCELTGFGLVWRNVTNPSTALDLWFVIDGQTRYVTQANNGDAVPFAGTVKGDQLFTIQAGKPGHAATITTAGHWTPTRCVFDAQAVVQ
jgi:hypothetical protein